MFIRSLTGIFSATVAAFSFAHSANAQDWAGAYGGVHLGFAYAEFENRVPAFPGPTGDAGSAIGGFQFGYNWQNGTLVYGAEIDFSLMELEGNSAGGSFNENTMGSLRFRMGQVIGQTLVYGSLGVAWTEKDTTVFGVGSDTEYAPGIMVGGGAEKWLTGNLTGRVEAFYVNVPKSSQNLGGLTASAGSQNLILRAGLNLHF